jgi:hypothetical protein
MWRRRRHWSLLLLRPRPRLLLQGPWLDLLLAGWALRCACKPFDSCLVCAQPPNHRQLLGLWQRQQLLHDVPVNCCTTRRCWRRSRLLLLRLRLLLVCLRLLQLLLLRLCRLLCADVCITT